MREQVNKATCAEFMACNLNLLQDLVALLTHSLVN